MWHPVHIDPDTLYGTRLPSLYICGQLCVFPYINFQEKLVLNISATVSRNID